VALGCIADWQSAGFGSFRTHRQWFRLAECHSAKQQAASLRYAVLRHAAFRVVVSICAPGRVLFLIFLLSDARER
jgi:hypothetical protein